MIDLDDTILPPTTLAAVLTTAVAAARRGGRVVTERFQRFSPEDSRQKDGISGQGHWNPVSEADLETERAIIDTIKMTFPDHAFLGEENVAGQVRDAEHLWIIDPIDGTSNYLHGTPHFAVSVGYARRGEILAAACLDPLRGELYSAFAGGGAFMNGNPLSVAPTHRLEDALIATGFYYDRGEIMERTLGAIRALFHHGIHGIRRTGSAVLDICWTAAGRFDAFFEFQLKPWDFLPASLIAREAGATATTVDGEVLGITGTTALCCTPSVHSAIVELLATIGRVG